MTQGLEDALTVRLEASLTKFEKQMKRALDVGGRTVNELQNRFDRSNKKMAQSAEKSAMVIGREMDRLRTKYDPVFAASKRYEKELTELNRAHKVGAIDAHTYNSALNVLNSQYTRMNAGTSVLKKSMRGLSTSTRGGGGGIQNIAYQVGDFAVQVGAGTAASVALGQQLPQLLGGFGALGAVLGAVVAIGVPLIAYFLKQADSAAELTKITEKLEKSVSEYQSAVENATTPTDELTEKYGTATGAAREFLKQLQELARLDTEKALKDNINAITTAFGSLSLDKAGSGQMGRKTRYEMTLTSIQNELQLAKVDAQSLLDGFVALSNASGPKDAVEASKQLLDIMEQVLGPYQEMPEKMQDLYRGTVDAADQQARLVKLSEDAANGIRDASSEAAGLARNLGAAVAQMQSLANARVADARTSMQLAKVRLDTVGKPVERAGKTAVVNYRNELDDGGYSLISGGRAGDLAGQEDKVRQAAENAARLSLEADKADAAYNKLQSSINKGSKKKKIDPFSIGESSLLAAERNLEMLGKTSSEVIRLEAKYKMLDEAKRRNIDLDLRSAETGLTLGETIDRNADQVARLTEKYKQGSKQQEFFNSATKQVQDGLIDAAIEGEDFIGTLEDVAKSFAKAALQATLFGRGPLAGAFGGGGSGGGLGSLLGGLFGLGGASAFPAAPTVGVPAGLYHNGGTVGVGGTSDFKFMAPDAFNNAPKFHNGKYDALKPNEMHAILRKDELVVPPEDLIRVGGGSRSAPSKVVVNIINNSSAQISHKEERDGRGGVRHDVMIGEAVAGAINRKGSPANKAAHSRQSVIRRA